MKVNSGIMEPLVKPASEEANLDVSLWKVIAIGAAGFLAALAGGYFLKLFLEGGDSAGLWATALLVVFVAVFLIVFLLETIFIKADLILNYLLLLESAAYILPFLLKPSFYVLLAWASLVFFFWVAVKRGKHEIDNQMTVKFFRIERHTLPHVFTGLSLFVSLLYLNQIGFNQAVVSKKSIQAMLEPSAPLVQKLAVENFSFDMTVYQLVDAIVIKQAVEQLGVSPQSVPADLKNAGVMKALDNLRAAAAGYGVSFRNSDTITDVVYNYTVGQLKKVPEPFQIAIPVGFVLIVFFTVKGLGIVFHWLTAVPAYVIYKLLLAVGFARLSLESKSREIVVL